ncbi:major facilitator superfamily transporter [Colletotrichum tamarilloi]|uniref:Major facilitator superfamily transporter n=1 Tax=Colletotrichum tamarilloi TaxID=1209934 RepID=A0ABQ9R312_9PEZI|nr:major facilitator superfamily transporter [Colletotrichum tamarilloi]KAK1493231.1 major facilitator superfamily transporter [Colletotrichum tamarilloi]
MKLSLLNRKAEPDAKDPTFVPIEVKEALKVAPEVRDYAGARAKYDPTEIALVRRLDWMIMPILWFIYWLNYLDRNAIALARLNTLEEDLNLTSTEYQTCVSILFVGYVIVGIPANMVVTRVRPSLWMSSCMAVWAIISALTAVSQNYTGLLLTRFFLGITEAPYYPGALYVLATFYTRKELATRISILYTGNILATAFAGLIALGIFQMHGMAGIAGWRWLFIIQGVVTLIIAIMAFFILPDEPLTTRWLSPEERILANERILQDTVGNTGQTTTWSGLLEAAKDPKVWLFTVMQHCHLGANGFKNFFPTAVETLGFNETITLVLTCPPYLIAGVISIAWSWSSGRFNERTWHITIAKSIAVFGFILGCATLNTGARYFSMVVFSVGTYAVNSIILGWVSATCSQTKEKKASSLAIVNCIAVASFIWTPYMWPKSDEPRYVMAMSSSAALSVATAMGAWAMRFWLKNENRKIRQSENENVLFYAY